MTRRLAISGSSPAWSRGLAAELEDAGYDTTIYESIDEWRPGLGGTAVVVAVEGEADIEALEAFSQEFPAIPVVAVVDELTVTTFAVAMRSGAAAVVDEKHSTAGIASVIEQAFDGEVLAPRSVIAGMAEWAPEGEDVASWLSDEEASWLVLMAGGNTVAEVAEQAGYSEREMFRKLRHVYRRLGVRNRTEALLWASRHGLIS